MPLNTKKNHLNRESAYHVLFACALDVAMASMKIKGVVSEEGYFSKSEKWID